MPTITDVCTVPVEPPKTLAWCWPSTCRWSPANFPPHVISEGAKACQLAGFTVSYGLAGTPDELFCTNVTEPFFFFFFFTIINIFYRSWLFRGQLHYQNGVYNEHENVSNTV